MENGPSVIPQITAQHSDQIEDHVNVVYEAVPGGNPVCLVVSNDNVNYQLIQIPSESVFVVGNGTDETYQPEPTISEPLEADPPEEAPPDHSADHYTQAYCRECNEYMGSNTALKAHNAARHKGVYTCGICWRGFAQPTDLKRHTLSHYRKHFSCVMCNAAFSRPSSLKLHIAKKHKNSDGICRTCGEVEGGVVEGGAQHVEGGAQHVEGGAQHVEGGAQHVEGGAQHVEGGAQHVCYKCAECLSVFRTSRSYEEHSCRLSRRTFKCPFCEETFTRNQGLLDHMLNEENRRTFQCVVCKDSFNTKAQLRRHQRVHLPEDWLKCDVCGNRYATASGFRSHNIRQHRGHAANSVPRRSRVAARVLSKRAPHRQYRDDAVQTTNNNLTSTSSQTGDTGDRFHLSPRENDARGQVKDASPARRQRYRRNKHTRKPSYSPQYSDISPSLPSQDEETLDYTHDVSPMSEQTIYMDNSLLLKCNEEIIIDTDD